MSERGELVHKYANMPANPNTDFLKNQHIKYSAHHLMERQSTLLIQEKTQKMAAYQLIIS